MPAVVVGKGDLDRHILDGTASLAPEVEMGSDDRS
jgi:hypothetical protein